MSTKVFSIEEAKQVLGLTATATNTAETDQKDMQGLEVKNTVMHTGNVGHGAELAPQEEFARSIIDETIQSSTLLSALPGFHGSNLPANLKVPVIGEFGYFENAPEYTTAGTVPNDNNTLPNTAMITLKSEKLIMTVPVSDEMLERGIDIEAYIRKGVSGAWGRTTESIILNADDTTGNANINAKGANVTASDKRHWFRPAGLRKTAIAQATTLDIGAVDEDDIFALAGLLGEKAANPADCLFVMNRRTALKLSQLPTLKQAYASGRTSTVVKGMETNILGSDIYVSREMSLADATGAVSNTAGDNTTGSILYMNKSAPQFGFNNIRIEAKRIEGYGYHFVVTGYFAHAIASKLVGTDPAVALGVNVTL